MALVEPAAPRSSHARSDRRPEPQPRTTAQVAQMAEVSPEDELDAMLKAEGVAEAVPPEKAAAAGGKVELSGDSQKLQEFHCSQPQLRNHSRRDNHSFEAALFSRLFCRSRSFRRASMYSGGGGDTMAAFRSSMSAYCAVSSGWKKSSSDAQARERGVYL